MSALDTQVGGEHYKSATIQPVQYIEANDLKFLEGCVVKRVTRHNKPTGKGRQDIEKAIHELQILLELRYGQPVDAFADEPLTEGERLDIYNQLQAQARNLNADPDVQTGVIKPRNRPTWPARTDYHWMCQQPGGQWYVCENKPEAQKGGWCVHGMHGPIDLPYPIAGDWRDTLIERGADE